MMRKYCLVRDSSKTIFWDEEKKGKLTAAWVLAGSEYDVVSETDDTQIEEVEEKEVDEDLEELIYEAVSNEFESFVELQRNADTSEIAYTTNGKAYKHDGARWKKFEERDDVADTTDTNAQRKDIDWS